jgi:phage terminase large subunit GpA-like protein
MLTPQNIPQPRRCKSTLPAHIDTTACGHLLEDGRRYRFYFSQSERQAWRKRKKEQPSKWAQKNIKIPTGPFEGNFINFDITPHLIGIIDAYALPFIRKITIVAAPQTTKTTAALICKAWSSVFEPGPTLSVYPTEVTGAEIMTERILPTYKSSPQLRKLMTGRKEDESKNVLRLRSMYHRIAWSGSLTSLAHRSIKIMDMDEVDKYAEAPSDRETGTIYLAKLRQRAYGRSSKLLMMSSCSTEAGPIWQELTKETAAVFIFWVKCPFCGGEQYMDFTKETFWWPHGEDGHSLDRKEIKERRLARYICQMPGCRQMWDDDSRDKAARRGTFRLETADGTLGEEMFHHLNRTRVQSIGFIIPSWISYFVSLSEVAFAYLKAKDKDLSPEERFFAYKDFQNAHRSRPWKFEVETPPVTKIRALCDDRPAGILPGGDRVAALLFGIDTQDDCFYLSIWAFGYGMQNEQWLVLRRIVDSTQALAELLWGSVYYDTDGQAHHVEFGMIDMQGHRQKEVLEFCLQYEGLISPCMGSNREMTQAYSFSQKEYFPDTQMAIPGGGIRAFRINTKMFKDNLAVKLAMEPDTPGCVHLYRHAELGDDYCNQLISEARDEKGVWTRISSRDNHDWDCMVVANCVAEYKGVKLRPRPEDVQEEEEVEIVRAELA